MLDARLSSEHLLAEWMVRIFLFGYLRPLVPISISDAAKGPRQRIPVCVCGGGAVDHRGIARFLGVSLAVCGEGSHRAIKPGGSPKYPPRISPRAAMGNPPSQSPKGSPRGFPRSTCEIPQSTFCILELLRTELILKLCYSTQFKKWCVMVLGSSNMLGVKLKSKRLLAEWMFPTFLFGYLWPHAPSSISAVAKGSSQRIPGGEGGG